MLFLNNHLTENDSYFVDENLSHEGCSTGEIEHVQKLKLTFVMLELKSTELISTSYTTCSNIFVSCWFKVSVLDDKIHQPTYRLQRRTNPHAQNLYQLYCNNILACNKAVQLLLHLVRFS